MDHRREARVGFVVTSGDAAELLDLAEEVLDQMPPLVHLEVAGDGGDPIGFGWDHGNRAPVVQLGAEPVAVEGFVRQQGGEVEIRQKRGDTGAVVSGSRTNRTRAHRPARRSWSSTRPGNARWPASWSLLVRRSRAGAPGRWFHPRSRTRSRP